MGGWKHTHMHAHTYTNTHTRFVRAQVLGKDKSQAVLKLTLRAVLKASANQVFFPIVLLAFFPSLLACRLGAFSSFALSLSSVLFLHAT